MKIGPEKFWALLIFQSFQNLPVSTSGPFLLHLCKPSLVPMPKRMLLIDFFKPITSPIPSCEILGVDRLDDVIDLVILDAVLLKAKVWDILNHV